MKEKIKLTSSSQIIAQDSQEITDIAQKRGIKIPSVHLGFFKTIYAKIEEPNLNGIRLERKAVEESLPGLIGSQTNFSHLGAGFVMGSILDAWINADTDEIEVVYSFFKELYPDEYERSVQLAKEGKLFVSFELMAERDKQEHLKDGTIRLHQIDFTGMGHLMDEAPAYPKARVYEYAKALKNRISNYSNRELIYASVIEKTCDDILSHYDEPMLEESPITYNTYLITSTENDHFHVAEIDNDGNGITFDTIGSNDDSHIHEIINWQVQKSHDHAHRIMNEILAKVKEHIKSSKEKNSSNQGGINTVELTKEQKEQIAKIREELGDFAKDVADKDLLEETVVAELRKEMEAKKAEKEASEKTELEKAQEKVAELEAKVAELTATLEAKGSEIEEVRANAEKIGERKTQLKDNEFAKDFTDEDYLNDEKFQKAIQDKKDAETIAQRKEELKENTYAKDFTDADYLNDDKVELAKVKAEKDELSAKVPKTKETASEETSEETTDMETGSGADSEEENSYEKVMASVREAKKDEYTKSNKVYTRK